MEEGDTRFKLPISADVEDVGVDEGELEELLISEVDVAPKLEMPLVVVDRVGEDIRELPYQDCCGRRELR